MRLFFCSLASLLLVVLVIGCSTVSPDECWPNTSGGFGGSGTIPIGAGVGAVSSGDFDSPPPNGGTPNPCVTPESPPPSQSTCQVPSSAGEGATSWICGEACSSKCPAPGMATFVTFSPSEFPFVTTVPDDGMDKGGGWQVAKVNLGFTRIVIPSSVITWYCAFNIEMPLRTEGMGKISASLAASLSVEITEGVARGMDYSLPQGIFCSQFIAKADAAFKSKYQKLGAKVTQ